MKTLSLPQVEALAIEAAAEAAQLDPPRLGALVIKRSGGPGTKTPHLIIMTEETWNEMTGTAPGVPRSA